MFTLASWFRLVNELVVPYAVDDAAPVPNSSLVYATARYHLAHSWWLDFDELEQIKRLPMEKGADSIGFSSDDYYRSDTSAYYRGENTGSTHSVGLISWGDAFSRDNFSVLPPGDGAWLVTNSRVPEFGDDGCFWISYFETSLDNVVFYDVVPVFGYYRNYQYDDGILPTSMLAGADANESEIRVSVSNVFVLAAGNVLVRCRFLCSMRMCRTRFLFQPGRLGRIVCCGGW